MQRHEVWNKSLASKLLLNNSRCVGEAERTKISHVLSREISIIKNNFKKNTHFLERPRIGTLGRSFSVSNCNIRTKDMILQISPGNS